MDDRKIGRVLWIVAGNQENESAVALVSGLAKQTSADNVLVTNCLDYARFPGRTYLCETTTTKMFLAEKYRELVLTALAEKITENADIIITTGISAAVWAHVVVLENNRFRERPIVYVSPKIPEGPVQEMAGGEKNGEDLFWWLVGTRDNFHAVALDNDREVDMAKERILKVCPQSRKQLFRLVLWRYSELQTVEKRDAVVWSGRYNVIKNPNAALRLMSILEGRGVKCEIFIPTLSVKYMGEVVKARNVVSNVYVGLNSIEYVKQAGGAKVLLITSGFEGFPLGYIELIEKGVVPVLKKRPWMNTFLGEDWPLAYVKDGEGVEMCLSVLSDYDKWLGLLRSRLANRYNSVVNWGEILSSIWRSYVAGDYRHDYSKSGGVRRL